MTAGSPGLLSRASASALVTDVNPVTLQSALRAAGCSEGIDTECQSLSSQGLHWQGIASRAIGFDSFRVETGTLYLTVRVYRNFLLSRILEIRESRKCDVPSRHDGDWSTIFASKIRCYPARPDIQVGVLSLECGIRGGMAKIKARIALLHRALKHLGLDNDLGAIKSQSYRSFF